MLGAQGKEVRAQRKFARRWGLVEGDMPRPPVTSVLEVSRSIGRKMDTTSWLTPPLQLRVIDMLLSKLGPASGTPISGEDILIEDSEGMPLGTLLVRILICHIFSFGVNGCRLSIG